MLKTSPEWTRKCVFMELQTIFEKFEVLTDEELMEVSGGGGELTILKIIFLQFYLEVVMLLVIFMTVNLIVFC